MNINTEFNSMVNKLAKKGSDIKKSLTAEKCHLLHMAVGIAGEAAEACGALAMCDKKNLHEELGDLQFYIRGLVKDIDGVEYEQLVTGVCSFNTAPIHALISSSGDVLDYIKKHVMYEKELDTVKLQAALDKLNKVIAYLYDVYDLFHDDVLKGNIEKLNTRYAKGTYSNEQAQTRADKI